MIENIIQIKNINKTYNKAKSKKTFKAVDNVSFDVESGTCFGFLGPNGAGKSTTMKMLYSRINRDSKPKGKMKVLGYDPGKYPLKVKYHTGVVPQEDNLDEEISVYQNLKIYAKFYGMNDKDSRKRIDDLLGFMELTEKAKASTKELSGGMKRRLVIARALLHEPKLLILDEPTTGLDPQVRHTIWKKLRELKSNGMTILLTTHYMDEAYQICDSIIIMDKGKKVIEGCPKKLLSESLENYVMELIKGNKEDIEKIGYDEKIVRTDDLHDPPHYYSNDFNALKKISDNLNGGEFYLRQTNLEDLFMKLTGRRLNEFQ
ncbi:MAG TPA: ABC transporter ATP-binding protein [Victivallales bacterium]|nr:ABC transporter ATP-binding protein [Victivallales bacterium]